MAHHDPKNYISKKINIYRQHRNDGNIRKDHPWHAFSFMIICNKIRDHNVCQELKEGGVQLENGEEEYNRHDDVEYMA